jgi:hypothetical protein
MLNFNRIKKIFQGQINPNRDLLRIMKDHKFAMNRIRKSLIDLNDIDLVKLSASGNVAHSQIYETLRGKRKDKRAVELISRSLGLDRNELFPE